MSKQTQKLLLMLVIGILIGATGILAWKSNATPSLSVEEGTTPSGVTPTDMKVASDTPTIISRVPDLPSAPEIPVHTRVGMNVADQPAGSSVFVAGLVIKESKWVAVYEDRAGEPGNILGASHVFPGYISTSVDLLRNTEPGKKYYVAVLNDDGDETFNRLSDLPPLSPEAVVIVSFLAQ